MDNAQWRGVSRRVDRERPAVTVVVACKSSEATIASTVVSLLAQDYDGPLAIKLVGDRGDSTWSALGDFVGDSRLSIMELPAPVPGRDVNVKRNLGLGCAQSDILAVTDSDMVLPRDWVTQAVAILQSGTDCTAGGMASTHDDYWGMYVDRNVFGAKTPRVPSDYIVDRANFGHARRKPPITANVFFTRRLWEEVGPFDPGFQRYEDYEWFWRVVDAGYQIQFARHLAGGHQHRQGIKRLSRDYWYSGRGCAEFIRTHPDSPLAKRRLTQIGVLSLGALLSLVASVIVSPLWVALAALGSLVALGVTEAVMLRRLRALSFPFVTLVLGSSFYIGASNRLLRPMPGPLQQERLEHARRTQSELSRPFRVPSNVPTEAISAAALDR
jgi:GT2 family glycosyltransferase